MLNTMLIRTKLLRDARTAATQYIHTFDDGYRSSWSNNIGIELTLRAQPESKLQAAIDHCLFEANSRRLRHIGNQVYEPIEVNGILIKAYRPYKKMEAFINSLHQNIFTEAHTLLSSAPGIIKHVIQHLSNADYNLFPAHTPDYEWIAFRDGMLHIYTDEFTDEFFKHGDAAIPDHVYAGKFHDADLDYDKWEDYRGDWDNPAWMKIPCALQTVTHTQFPPGMCFAGRLARPPIPRYVSH
jgi:hypothetical protein